MRKIPFFLLLLLALLIAACTESNDEGEGDAPSASDAPALRGSAMEPPVELVDFTAPSTQGDFTLSQQRGKLILLYFGFTNCPDFCPATLADLNRVIQALDPADAERVQVIMVTADPERDTLERLTRYMTGFNTGFIGVRPEGQALQDLLGQFYAVAARREVDSAMGYTIDHTTSVFVIDPQGRWVSRFPNGTSRDDIVHDVEILLREADEG